MQNHKAGNGLKQHGAGVGKNPFSVQGRVSAFNNRFFKFDLVELISDNWETIDLGLGFSFSKQSMGNTNRLCFALIEFIE